MTYPSQVARAVADRYRLERELGAGGMATVYLAHDLKHDRKVALKVLKPELAAVIGAERFLAEIRTTANLQHPHVLALFDSGQLDGTVFYVMPFVEGESLRDRLEREKQLPVDEALRIAREVGDALHYAHQHGVIHRDIKPENILLQGGHALVADFGIALAASKTGGSRMTETGMSLGTPRYMSPEQAMGERDLDARTDIYALGCVLYEMLTGDPPFTASTAQAVVAKVLTEKPASVVGRRDRVPPHVEEAVLTALEKLPADRFASARDFVMALAMEGSGASRSGQQRTARVGTRGGTGVDWRMAAVGGLAAGAALTAMLLLRGETSGRIAGGGLRSQLTFNGSSRLPAISPNGDYVAFVDRRCPRGTPNACRSSLYVQERTGRPVAILSNVPHVAQPRFSADGLSLVFSGRLDSARVGLFTIPRLGGVPRRIGPPGVFDINASGDSAILVTTSDAGAHAARVIALASGAVGDSVVLPRQPLSAIAWSPDGRLLALVSPYTRLMIVRRDGSVADSVLGPFRSTVRWTPDGRGVLLFRALAVKEDDLDYYRVDASGNLGPAEVRIPAIQTLLTGEFDVASRTGQLALASGSATFDLWTFDVASPESPARQRTFGTTYYGSPAISPDGTRLYYQRGDAVGDNLYELTDAGVEEALTAEPYPALFGVAVSRDGRQLLFGHTVPGGHRYGVMDRDTRQTTAFEEHNAYSAVEIARDGLVFLLANGRGFAIREEGGNSRRVLVPDSVSVHAFATNRTADSAAVLVGLPNGFAIAVTPLAEWRPRWLHRFASDEVTHKLTWTDANGIYFWRWKVEDSSPTLWRVNPEGGRPAVVRSLPPACNTGTLVIATSAPRGVCWAVDERADIWLLSVTGVTSGGAR